MVTQGVCALFEKEKVVLETVGLPKEIKDGERRVALDPGSIKTIVASGAKVLVEMGAGTGAGFSDSDYRAVGGHIVDSAEEVWSAELVCKVKEPQESEWRYFRPGQRLFAYLHLAAEPRLARALMESEVEAFAFETLAWPKGLPLLSPMSEIAGRAAAIMGAFHLAGGSGTLMGGAAGAPPARVVVIGMGVAGSMAARGARGMDAEVVGLDVDLERLFEVHSRGIVTSTMHSNYLNIGDTVRDADLVVGAALVAGARAPIVMTKEHVSLMRPGSVVIDLAIDQGGCIETSRPTSLSEPTFLESGVIHYCVTNVPGQYPRTSSRALSAAVTPRLIDLIFDADRVQLSGSLNVSQGKIVHPVVASSLEMSV